jgi:hypothetical protein
MILKHKILMIFFNKISYYLKEYIKKLSTCLSNWIYPEGLKAKFAINRRALRQEYIDPTNLNKP